MPKLPDDMSNAAILRRHAMSKKEAARPKEPVETKPKICIAKPR